MTDHLCHILASKLTNLVEVSGGLATVWKSNDTDKKSKAAYWNFDTLKHELLVPDAKRESITYFEERSTTITGLREGMYRADLTLVGWVNTTKGVHTPLLIHSIQEVFKRPFNAAMFVAIRVQFVELLPESEQLFSRYQYDTGVKKYLQKPYDAFGLRMIVTYNLNPLC